MKKNLLFLEEFFFKQWKINVWEIKCDFFQYLFQFQFTLFNCSYFFVNFIHMIVQNFRYIKIEWKGRLSWQQRKLAANEKSKNGGGGRPIDRFQVLYGRWRHRDEPQAKAETARKRHPHGKKFRAAAAFVVVALPNHGFNAAAAPLLRQG